MTKLYGHLWITNQGESDDNGKPTPNFISWCEATKHFTSKHWKRAYERVVHEKREAAKLGEKSYPPDVVTFVEYGEPVIQRGQNYFDEVVWKIDPETGEKRPYRIALLEDETAKQKRYEKGVEECSKLLAMFD